jgi:hypothetical protein
MSWVADRVEDFGDSLASAAEGIVNVIEGVASDPKKLAAVAVSIAFPGAAAWIGSQLGLSGVAATIVGNTALGTISNGGDVGEALKGAVLQAGVQGLSGELKAQFGPTQDPISVLGGTEAIDNAAYNIEKTLTDFASKATTDVALATIMGKDPVAALMFSGAQAASSLIMNQVLENADIKSTYNQLPSAAKDSITAALTASLTGKDVGTATANALVNSAMREAKGFIKLQEAAESRLGKPFTAEELNKYSFVNDQYSYNKLFTEGNFDITVSFVENINKAKEVLGDSFDNDIAKEILRNSSFINTGDGNTAPVILDDDRIVVAAANTEYNKRYADTYGSPGITVADIYKDLTDTVDNRKALDEGWGGGAQQKYLYKRLYGEEFSPQQADLLEAAYSSNPPGELDLDQLNKYIYSIIWDWDWTKPAEENEKSLEDLLAQFEIENKAADAFLEKPTQEANVPGAEDLQNIINGSPGTQLASSDNDAALQAIEDLRNTAGDEDQDALSVLAGEGADADQDALSVLAGEGADADQDALGVLAGEGADADQDALSVLAGTGADADQDALSVLAGTGADADQDPLSVLAGEGADADQDPLSVLAGEGADADQDPLSVLAGEGADADQDPLSILAGTGADADQDPVGILGGTDTVPGTKADIITTTGGGVKTDGGGGGVKTDTVTKTDTDTDTSGGNLLALLSLLGGEQQPAKQKQAVSDDPYVEFDWSKPFQVNPFATPTTAPKMYEGGSIDELLELLQRRG